MQPKDRVAGRAVDRPVSGKRDYGRTPVNPASEAVEDGFFPHCLAACGTREFEHSTQTGASATLSRAVECPRGIHGYSPERSASVCSAGKAMEYALRPASSTVGGGREFVNNTAADHGAVWRADGAVQGR